MNHLPKEPKNIVVGLSGGVDSAVTALLLKKQGHNVSGVFMQNWQSESDDPHCTAEQDLSDAKAIANQIGIPLYTVNFSQDYWDQVFKHCLDEFAAGRTPNPDIWCNREIKFKVFLDHALKMNADYLATGHYARILRTASASDQQFQLLRGLDASKDQSYFLYTLNQNQLSKSLFPLGDMHKKDVRKMAEDNHLINYNKKDSTGICFIGERKFKDFLKGFLIAQPGDIKTDKGQIVGQHDGVMFYTLGQRKGLNIGGKKDFAESPWYVVNKDVKTNTLIVGQGHNHPLLFKNELWCDDIVARMTRETVSRGNIKCTSKIRYRQQDEACTITDIKNNSAHVVFKQPQRAVTPGQSIVFYDNEICLGGGIITEPTEVKA